MFVDYLIFLFMYFSSLYVFVFILCLSDPKCDINCYQDLWRLWFLFRQRIFYFYIQSYFVWFLFDDSACIPKFSDLQLIWFNLLKFLKFLCKIFFKLSSAVCEVIV
jgi:hypothetical protein